MAREKLLKHHQEDVRTKIKTSNLLYRLQEYTDGNLDLSIGQVTAIKILLNKTIPDLKNTEHTGNIGLNLRGAIDIKDLKNLSEEELKELANGRG